MPKKKITKIEAEKKERIFYYEILGIICLIIALFSITRLGAFGTYLMLTFRLLFGDWYFLVILLLFLYGIYCLLVHKKMKIISIRYLGIFLILISLMVLSHFSMFKYINKFEGNQLTTMISLYFNYFKENLPSKMIGGGIIGGIIFYGCYFLFSSIGTILLMIFLFMIGIVFICKKTFKDFIIMIKNFFIKIFKFFKKIFNKIKEDAKSLDEDYKTEPKKRKISKRILSNIKLNYELEKEHVLENLNKIKKVLEELEIMYKEINYNICPNIHSIFIDVLYEIDFSLLYEKLNIILKDRFLIKFNEEDLQIIIEINNLNQNHINFKYCLNNNDKFIIGMDDRKNLIEVDNNILILGNYQKIKEYLESLIIYPLFSKDNKKDDIIVFDLNNNLSSLKDYVTSYYESYLEIGSLSKNIEKVIELLNNEHYANIEKYNLNSESKINRKYIFINGLEKILAHVRITEKFEYLLRLSIQSGYYFIASYSSNSMLSSNILSLFEYKILLDYQTQIIGELVPKVYFKVINPEIEGFIKYKDFVIRLCLLKLTQEEKKEMKL